MLGLDRIIGLALPQNIASIRVLQKCGMTFERFAVDPHAGRVVLYSISPTALKGREQNWDSVPEG